MGAIFSAFCAVLQHGDHVQGGRDEDAQEELRPLLQLGELSGMVRSIVDECAPIAAVGTGLRLTVVLAEDAALPALDGALAETFSLISWKVMQLTTASKEASGKDSELPLCRWNETRSATP